MLQSIIYMYSTYIKYKILYIFREKYFFNKSGIPFLKFASNSWQHEHCTNPINLIERYCAGTEPVTVYRLPC